MWFDAGLQHSANRTTQGLRYLHCNLCETEWHVVRVKCSNCEQSRDLNYWSLDNEQAAIKAESCGDCGTYLKILYQEKDPKVEARGRRPRVTDAGRPHGARRLCPQLYQPVLIPG